MLEYWVKRNKSKRYSRRLIKLVNQRTKQIADNPFIFKSANFKDTRVASLGNFSIFFKVTHNVVYITAFWDNRQDPSKLLKILKG
ncbi:type II toxin-antitoxin system RelE/ParE family toxin [Salibacter sp.]|uniref:type II toxin-antitoxin system RelE/ParE family toxin n=1 Tax=Salibacter sp. TaxID=2010995 RepID=UPI00286FE963|nr:type II toxin-antitoxin system RelE/ParE family toxin [Salibacter sp.]MDR9486850.1 type II toxin-antitoxin system RelE/ParE family toxin [Salibacter sp.]